MRILYAGDSPVGGPANYLLGILRFLKADFFHVPPGKKLKPAVFKKPFDAILLSDFSRRDVPRAAEKALVEQVLGGAGLLMIGGWGSFSGPGGKWRGSAVEKILPVSCLNRDDRVNFPGGASIISKRKHPLGRSVNFKNPPVICGLNHLRPKPKSRVVLSAKKLGRGRKEYPLLVIDPHPQRRIAALATDLAPHWCGGWVDWGRRVKLRVTDKIQIEVGHLYVRFVSRLLEWLAGRGRRRLA